MTLVPWTAVRIPGGSRDSKLARRRRLWAWRDGVDLDVRDATGTVLTPEQVSWDGCDRPPGRPAEPGSRQGAPLLVRVSDEERAVLTRAAESAGEPLSTWVRAVALRAAR